MAKARSFQDTLSKNHASDDAIGESELLVEDVLAEWPTVTCAIEFYIGSRYVYVFCVLSNSEISAHRLSGSVGKPLEASELVGRITDFVSSMEFGAQKMLREPVSGRGFDRTCPYLN